MSTCGVRWRRLWIVFGSLLGSWMLCVSVHAAGPGGGGHFGGARVGAMGGYAGGLGGPRPGSSVIRHGSTGFSIYTQRSVTRVIGEPPVSRTISLPDGRSAHIIGDGSGGAYVFGSSGNHRILGNRALFNDHGR